MEAKDHLTGRRVAIKKINAVFDVFENAKRIYREVRILADMHHPNIVPLYHLCQPSDLAHFTDLYVVFECMDTDLAKLCKDDTQIITIPHIRCARGGLGGGLGAGARSACMCVALGPRHPPCPPPQVVPLPAASLRQVHALGAHPAPRH